jgi:hypothetical protein
MFGAGTRTTHSKAFLVELSHEAAEILGARYAPATIASMKVGEKKWRAFCQQVLRRHSMNVLPAFPAARTAAAMEAVEHDLLCFIAWLARSFASTTVAQYYSHVKALAAKQIGMLTLTSAEISFERADMAVKILKIRRPPVSKPKVAFTIVHLRRLWAATKSRFFDGDFEAMAMWAASTLAFQQLLRLNEVVDTGRKSAASSKPFLIGSITFRNANGSTIPRPTSAADALARESTVAGASLKMVPSKADQAGKNPPLQLPIGQGQAKSLSPCWALWRLMGSFPVSGPGFTRKPLISNGLRSAGMITIATFMRAFKAACRRARIQYSQFGLSAFRVGGASRLQEVGAGEAEIQSAGRWSSEAWRTYVRRSTSKGHKWATRMLGN